MFLPVPRLLLSGLSIHPVPADKPPAAQLHFLPAVAFQHGQAGEGKPFSWAGNPLLPSCFPKKEPDTEEEGVFLALTLWLFQGLS